MLVRHIACPSRLERAFGSPGGSDTRFIRGDMRSRPIKAMRIVRLVVDEYDSSGRPTEAGVRSTATGSVHRAQRQFVDSGLRIGESLRSVLSCTSIGSALRPHLITTSVSVMSSLGRFCHARGEPGAWFNEPLTNHRHPSAVSSTLGGRKELRHPRMRQAGTRSLLPPLQI